MRRRDTRDRNAQLDALYAELPGIDCQGRCWDSCGPIDMSGQERRRISDTGVYIPKGSFTHVGPMPCPALTMLHRCSVYEIRPLICRIWGLTRELPCTYGCRPERYLTEPEAFEFLARACDISGEPGQAKVFRDGALPENREALARAKADVALRTELLRRELRRR